MDPIDYRGAGMALGALGALAVLLALYLGGGIGPIAHGGTSPVIAAGTSGTMAAAKHHDGRGRADLSADSRAEAPVATRQLRVVDARGRPVAGAALYRSAAWAPFVTEEHRLATANADGLIEWRPAPDDLQATLSVVHADFLPAVADGEATEQTVRLRAGVSFAVHCVDDDGGPVPGVHVALGRDAGGAPPLLQAVFAEVAGGHIVPGSNPERAVFVAVSDDAGAARFPGLPRSRYSMRVEHPRMIRVDTSDAAQAAGGGIVVPGPEPTVSLAPVYAAVVHHPGQEPVTFSGMMPRDQFESRVPTEGHPGVRALRKAFPDGCVVSGVACAELRAAGRLPRAPYRLLLSHSGWIDLDLELQPLTGDLEPVEIAKPPTAVCRQRRLVVRPPLPELADFPAPIVELHGESDAHDVRGAARLGDRFWLPTGRYAVSAHSQFVDRALELPESIEVTDTGPTEIMVPRLAELVPCELRFVLPRGMVLSSLSGISVRHASGDRLDWSGWHALDAQVMPGRSPRRWLTPGEVTLQATEPRLGTASTVVHVARSEDIQPLELRWPDL